MDAKTTWRTAAAVVVAMAATAALAAADGGVRPLQPRGAKLLDEGMRRTAAMRELVDELRRSDVVVYVDLDPNEPGGLEGSTRFRVATAEVRYLRVWLQPRRCDEALLAVLAHELQHAVEVARATGVRTPEAFKALYTAAGRSANVNKYETAAALAMGERMRRELEESK
jgi:hypothetical protein